MTFRSALFVSAFMLQSAAIAVPYVDIQNPNVLLGSNGYIGIFNLVSPGSSTYTISGYSSGSGTFSDRGGYLPNTELANATASFYFADDNDLAKERVDVFIGLFDGRFDVTVNSGGSVTGLTHITFGANSLSLEIIETFGGLNYVVKADTGDVKLKYAMLTANTVDAPAAVAEGGSIAALLGSSLCGIALLRRYRGVGSRMVP